MGHAEDEMKYLHQHFVLAREQGGRRPSLPEEGGQALVRIPKDGSTW